VPYPWEKEAEGPPAGYSHNIELEGKDYDQIDQLLLEDIRNFINTKRYTPVLKK